MAALTRRGPGRPPAAKSAETRGRILRAAREVFSELGYDGATFQEMAVRAELTRPAINHYFPSKLTLYRHVVEQTNQAVIGPAIQAARAESTFEGRMSAFVRTAVAAQNQDPSVAAFLVTSLMEGQRHPQLNKDGNTLLELARDFTTWVLGEAVAAGELPAGINLEVTSEMLVSMLLGLAMYAGFVGTPNQLADVSDQFLGMLAGGFHTG